MYSASVKSATRPNCMSGQPASRNSCVQVASTRRIPAWKRTWLPRTIPIPHQSMQGVLREMLYRPRRRNRGFKSLSSSTSLAGSPTGPNLHCLPSHGRWERCSTTAGACARSSRPAPKSSRGSKSACCALGSSGPPPMQATSRSRISSTNATRAASSSLFAASAWSTNCPGLGPIRARRIHRRGVEVKKSEIWRSASLPDL